MKVLDNTKLDEDELCPCNDCENYKQCADEKLACRAFYISVDYPTWPSGEDIWKKYPDEHYYQLIFGED